MGYLDASVSNKELKNDMRYTKDLQNGAAAAGEVVGERADPMYGDSSRETRYRSTIAAQSDVLSLWNSYFDRHDVDVIMAPPQLVNAVSYHEAVTGSIPIEYKDEHGSHTVHRGTYDALQVT